MHHYFYQTIVITFLQQYFSEKGKHILVFLFFILIPLFFNDLILEPTNLPRFLYFSLVLLLGLIFLLKKSELIFPPAFLFFLLASFYVMNLLSVSWSINKGDALYESQKVFLGLTTIAVFLNYIRNDNDELQLIRSLQWIILICCIYPTIQIFQAGSLDRETMYDIQGFCGHRNLLASLLMIFLPYVLYCIVFIKGGYRYLSFILLAWLLVLIVVLQVRSVYLGTLVGLSVTGFFVFRAADTRRRKLLIFLTAGAVILIAVLIVAGTDFKDLNVRSYFYTASGIERLKIWQKTWLLFMEHPWWGVGAANWQYNFMKFGVADVPNISLKGISFQRPHNDLLWVLSETGVFCFLILLLKMGTILFYSAREVIRNRNIKVLLCFSFLCALITDAFFSFPKERIVHIVFSCMLLALLLRNLQQGSLLVKRGNIPVYAGILVLLFGLIVGAYRFRGEYYSAELYGHKQKNESPEVIRTGLKAISAFYESDPTSTPVASYLGAAYFEMNQVDSAIYFAEMAFRLSPYDFRLLSNYGLALERSGRREEAKRYLREAIRINPHFESARFNMVVTEYNSRNYKEALRWLKTIPQYGIKYQPQLRAIEKKLDVR